MRAPCSIEIRFLRRDRRIKRSNTGMAVLVEHHELGIEDDVRQSEQLGDDLRESAEKSVPRRLTIFALSPWWRGEHAESV